MNLEECVQCMKVRQMNCAETVLLALSDTYELGVTREELHTMSGFGGGICGDICGALCGSLAALGMYHVYDNSHKTVGFLESCREFTDFFHKEMGDSTCTGLSEKYHTEEQGCALTVVLAQEVFRKYRELEARERPQYVLLGSVDRAVRRSQDIHHENPQARILILVDDDHVSLEDGLDREDLQANFGIELRLSNKLVSRNDEKGWLTVLDRSIGNHYIQRYDCLEEV